MRPRNHAHLRFENWQKRNASPNGWPKAWFLLGKEFLVHGHPTGRENDMAQFIESSGEIEIVNLSPRSHAFAIGDRIQLIFRPIDEPNPPYKLKITAPSGKLIVDTIVRSLPTDKAQSAPPFEFSPSVSGIYLIEIRETAGRAYGNAKLKIS